MILSNLKKRLITSIFLIILLFYFLLKFLTHLFFNCLGHYLVEFSNIVKKIIKNKVKLFFANFIFVIYIFIFCIIFSYFSNYLQLKLLLFLILIGCISSDIGGFVIGKLVKGPKLTRISPNKTISGSIGSILFTIVIYSSFIFYLTNNLSFKTFFIAILISIACQVGDLFFSLLKRKAKIKDTGNFLPGHGGILDRLRWNIFGNSCWFTFNYYNILNEKKICILGSTVSIGLTSLKNFRKKNKIL